MTVRAEHDAVLVDRARSGDREAFDALVAPYRRELHVHCYRMLASLHDAEDLVQETLLRAWRGIGTLRGGAVRAWLYSIATNACLNHIRKRPRVVVPARYDASGSQRPSAVEVFWVQPYPDGLLDIPDIEPGPAERATSLATTSLAFLCAVQMLSPLQRAALILRDVLAFSSKEVASALKTSPAAVNSALQRARARLSDKVRAEPPFAAGRSESADELLVRRFVHAWERADIAAIVGLLAKDAILAMPPAPFWQNGAEAIGAFLSSVPAEGHLETIPLVRTRANGCHAVAAYIPSGDAGPPQAYGIMVLGTADGLISQITGFADPGLFVPFGLPAVLEAGARGHAGRR